MSRKTHRSAPGLVVALYDAERVRDMRCFDERVDVQLDGTTLRRPVTPWS